MDLLKTARRTWPAKILNTDNGLSLSVSAMRSPSRTGSHPVPFTFQGKGDGPIRHRLNGLPLLLWWS